MRTRVEPAPNVPPRVGLIVSADTSQPELDRWEQGIEWQPESCGFSGVADPCAVGTREAPRGPGISMADTYIVWAGETCSALGSVEREWQARARRNLEQCESKEIANELWGGALARARTFPNRYLTHPDSDKLTTAGEQPLDVLALLEQGLADCSCGSVGMIHATRQLATYWSELGVLRRERGLLLTINDTIVVPDAGYDGSGPAAVEGDPPVAAAPGAVWAYATGMVVVRRGPIDTLPNSLQEARDWAKAVDRDVNDIEVLAQRTALATWDGCCHLAAQVDIDPPLVGGS